MRKSQILSQAMINKRKDSTAKPLNKIKNPIQPLIFLGFEIFLPISDCELTDQFMACFVLTICTNTDETITPSSYHDV